MPMAELVAVCAVTLVFLIVGMVGFMCAWMSVHNANGRRLLACFGWYMATLGCFDVVFLGVLFLWFDQCR